MPPETTRRGDDCGRRTMWLAFGVGLLLVVAWFIRHALLVIYISAIFAVVLKPAIGWVHRRSFFGWSPGRGTALLLIVLVISLLLGGLLVVALPSLTSNVMGFGETVVDKVGVIQERLHSIPLLRNLDLSHFRSWAASAIASLLPALGSATASIVTGLLLSAYFILDGAALLHRITKLLPPEPGARLERTLQKAGRRMRHWLAGQAMLMAILGTAATVTFGLMSLPDFYLLGILAGVANIVPLIGPLLTVVIAGAVALTVSPWHLLGVVIFYLVYQQVENAFLTPKIMKSQVSLSSAVIIAALLIGGELAGIAGALVAVPSAVLVAELASEYLIYERGPADERTDEAPEGTPD